MLAVVALMLAATVVAPAAGAQSLPGTPASVSVDRGDATLTASWPAVTGATHYHITYSTNSGKSWSLAALEHTGTAITIDADNDATYTVAVRAGNTTGWSGWLNSDPSGPYTPPAPNPPASVTVQRGNATLTATWPAVTGADHYHITYTTNNGQHWNLAALEHTGTAITIDADNDATYTVAVRAGNTTGWSGWLNSDPSGPYTPEPVAAPASVSVQRGNATLTATWPAVANADHYHITYTTDNGQSWNLAALEHTGTAITIDADNDATYTVAVRAGNTTGWSGWLNSAASGPYTPEPVAAPASVAIGMNMTEVTIGRENRWVADSLDLSWSAVNGAVSYQVECASVYADSKNDNVVWGDWSTCLSSTSATSTTITLGTYSYAFAYKVRVRAKGSDNVWGGWTESQVAWPVWGGVMPWVIMRGDGTLVVEWHQQSGKPVRWGVKYRVYCQVGEATRTKCADNIDPTTAVNADGFLEATINDLDLDTTGTQAVQNATSYNVGVQAFNATGSTAIHWRSSVNPLTTPAKFSDVTATRGDGTITVTVHRPAYSYLTSVQMLCQAQGGNSGACPGSPFTTDLDDASEDQESFTTTVGTANNSKAYIVAARGVNALGTGTLSDYLSVPAISSPGQISSITTERGTGTLTVSWTEPSGNYLSYDIECSSDSGTTWTATCTRGTSSVTGTTYSETLTGVTDSTAYTVRARAKNGLGTGSWRQSAAVPGAPTGVVASASKGGVSVTWTAPSSTGGSSIAKAQVRTRTKATGGGQPGDWSAAVDPVGDAGTSPARIIGLTAGTEVDVQLRVVNQADGASVWVDAGSATPQATTQPSGKATNVNFSYADSKFWIRYDFNGDDGGLPLAHQFTAYVATQTVQADNAGIDTEAGTEADKTHNGTTYDVVFSFDHWRKSGLYSNQWQGICNHNNTHVKKISVLVKNTQGNSGWLNVNLNPNVHSGCD